jgi:hypothetical protein
MDKQLIILAFYYNVSGLRRYYVEQSVSHIQEQFKNINNVNDKYNIEFILVTVNDRPTEIKLLYPNGAKNEDLIEFEEITKDIIIKNKNHKSISYFKNMVNNVLRKIKIHNLLNKS